jgi:hypothetical protein
MHAIAFLALVFGLMGMMLLDGQVFTHALTGIVCGMVSVVCGVVLSRRGRDPRWTSWMIAAMGLGLAIWCGIEAPSAYGRQKKFNDRSREHREHREKVRAPNHTGKMVQRTAVGS